MPALDDWKWRLRIGAAVGAWFWVVYGGADWLTGYRSGLRVLPSVEVPADAWLPFWPQAAWVYMTVTPALMLPLLVLRDRSSIRTLAWILAVEIAVAGMVYLIWPVAPSRTPDGALPAMMRIADQVNLTFNSVPSLHVALSVTSTMAMTVTGNPVRNAALAAWAVAISVSTLLTHQHFIADVVTGLMLAALGVIALRRLDRRRIGPEAAW